MGEEPIAMLRQKNVVELKSDASGAPATREEALKRVRALLPAIAARASKTESDRQVPAETVREIAEAGLFAMVSPRKFGGAELGFAAMVEVATELGTACGSTAWVYGVLAGHNWMAGLFTEQAQREVFSSASPLTASVFRMGGEITPEPGGFRLTNGQGRFCSGVDHASWVVIGGAVKSEGAPPEPGFFLIPISDVTIIDDWFTAGMRGTGSRSIRVDSAFIPEHRRVRMADLGAGTAPGTVFHGTPTYRLPFSMAQPFSLIGAPLGMAKGAIAAFSKSLGEKLRAMPADQQAEQGATLARVASAAADIDFAYAAIIADCERIDRSADPAAFSPVERAAVQRDLACAAQKCRYAVTSLFEASGGSGIYEGSPMERIWRDINSATAHVAFTWDTAASTFGRAVLGLAPSKYDRR